MTKRDAGQSISKFTTAEEQNEARRAAKAKQRSNHSGASTTTMTDHSGSRGRQPGFAWSPKDYASSPLFEVNRPKPKAKKPDFELASLHAGLALQHEAITSLTPGSPARLLAVEAISQYPLVSSDGARKRSDVALEQALEFLVTSSGIPFTGPAIHRAIKSVKAALSQTYRPSQAELVSA